MGNNKEKSWRKNATSQNRIAVYLKSLYFFLVFAKKRQKEKGTKN